MKRWMRVIRSLHCVSWKCSASGHAAAAAVEITEIHKIVGQSAECFNKAYKSNSYYKYFPSSLNPIILSFSPFSSPIFPILAHLSVLFLRFPSPSLTVLPVGICLLLVEVSALRNALFPLSEILIKWSPSSQRIAYFLSPCKCSSISGAYKLHIAVQLLMLVIHTVAEHYVIMFPVELRQLKSCLNVIVCWCWISGTSTVMHCVTVAIHFR